MDRVCGADMTTIGDKLRQLPWRKIVDTFAGVVLPAICFTLAWDFGPGWQSGRLSDYAELFLSGRVTTVFLPLLLFAVSGLLVATWSPQRRDRWWVRLAVASGVPLSMQYHLAVFFIMLAEGSEWLTALAVALVACPFILVLSLAIRWLFVRLGARWFGFGVGVLYLISVVISISVSSSDPLMTPALSACSMALFVTLTSAPCWCLAVYFRLSRELYQARDAQDRHRLVMLGLGASWLITWAVTWREGLRQLLLRYAELPTEPPDCFLATAASRGHPWLVGARPARAGGGQTFPATPQLRRFKAAELLLAGLAPEIHRRLRRAYDVVGRRLARRLNHPLAADLAWLALKPIELGAALILMLATRDSEHAIQRIWPARY